MNEHFRFGLMATGGKDRPRHVVNYRKALLAYCVCDDLADVTKETYLSAFLYDDDLRSHVDGNGGSVKGFDGSTWSPHVWFDIDRIDGIPAALPETRRLAGFLVDRFGCDAELLIFVSGSKGFHVGFPVALFQPAAAGVLWHRYCRAFAEIIATEAKVEIDSGVYDKVRLWRAPNTRHPKTGLYKIRLTFDELLGIDEAGIRRMATEPRPFDLPRKPTSNALADEYWSRAIEAVEAVEFAPVPEGETAATLNRATFDFIREGAATGDRHRLLYSAARNLGEFGCPERLALELLTRPGLDCGLPPADVKRQILCGLADQRKAVTA